MRRESIDRPAALSVLFSRSVENVGALPTLLLLLTLVIEGAGVARAIPQQSDKPSGSAGSFEKRLVAIEPRVDRAVDVAEDEDEEKEDASDKVGGLGLYQGDISPFADPIKLTNPRPINFLNPISGEANDDENPEEVKAEDARDRIVREFGKPDEDDRILGEEKAPKPFKAMLAALQAGDKGLAFQYGRRYVRYLNNVKELSRTAADIAGLGAEIEGSRPRQDHSEDPDPGGYLEIYKRELNETVKNESAILALNPEARELLGQVRQEVGEADDAAAASAAAADERPRGEAAERAMLYQNHTNRLPVDPNGKVSLIIFLSSADRGPNSMIGDVQRLAEKYAKDPKVRIEGISLLSLPELNIRDLQRFGMNITFPIREGKDLAASLGIEYTPAIAVVADTTGAYVLEKGHRTFWYLDELIRVVGGRPASNKGAR